MGHNKSNIPHLSLLIFVHKYTSKSTRRTVRMTVKRNIILLLVLSDRVWTSARASVEYNSNKYDSKLTNFVAGADGHNWYVFVIGVVLVVIIAGAAIFFCRPKPEAEYAAGQH